MDKAELTKLRARAATIMAGVENLLAGWQPPAPELAELTFDLAELVHGLIVALQTDEATERRNPTV